MTRAEKAASQKYALQEVTPENIKRRNEFIAGFESALNIQNSIDFLVEQGYTILTPTKCKSLDELVKHLKEMYSGFDSLSRCEVVEIINYAYSQGKRDCEVKNIEV